MPAPSATVTALLIRRGGRRGLQANALAFVAAATGAALLLVLTALWFAAGDRGDRAAWLTPKPDSAGNVIQARSVMTVGDRPVVVVDLARVQAGKAAPVPPGLAAFPKPGQTYVSPALRELLSTTPADRLADRFSAVVGRDIGTSGLASPDQLLAVVGHYPGDAEVAPGADVGNGASERAVVSGFRSTGDDALTNGDSGAVVLLIGLLGVPIVVLSASAGRLGAARRAQRLAALRLAGGSPRQVLTMAAYESFAVGAAGAVFGAAVYAATLPLLARFPLGIGGWFVRDLWVGLPIVVAMILAAAALSAVSTVSVLGRVVRDPLGVARRDQPGRARAIRIVAALALVGYVVVSARGGGFEPRQVAALVVLVYGAFWLAGPWVVARLGALTSRLARRPATLLAGRRLLDDPHSTWRTVCGLVLAGLVAGVVSLAQLDMVGANDASGQIMVPQTTSRSSTAFVEQARSSLRDAGLADATVRGAGDSDLLAFGARGVIVTVPGSDARLDTTVTALSRIDGAGRPWTADSVALPDRLGITGFAAASVAGLLLGFLVATISTLLTSAADVLDRRETYRLLRRAGAPLRLITRARAREIALPLVVLAGGATAAGIFTARQINSSLGVAANYAGAVRLGVCIAVGLAAIMVSLRLTRGLLDRVTHEEGGQQQ